MEYDLKLTQQDLAVIYQGLGDMPLKFSLNVFMKLQQEQAKQDEANALRVVPANEEGK